LSNRTEVCENKGKSDDRGIQTGKKENQETSIKTSTLKVRGSLKGQPKLEREEGAGEKEK